MSRTSLPDDVENDNIPDECRADHDQLQDMTDEQVVEKINTRLINTDSPVRVEKSGIHGYGLFAIDKIQADHKICDYWGELQADSHSVDLVSRQLEVKWLKKQSLFLMGSRMCAATWSNDAWGPERYTHYSGALPVCRVSGCDEYHVPWGDVCKKHLLDPEEEHSGVDVDLTESSGQVVLTEEADDSSVQVVPLPCIQISPGVARWQNVITDFQATKLVEFVRNLPYKHIIVNPDKRRSMSPPVFMYGKAPERERDKATQYLIATVRSVMKNCGAAFESVCRVKPMPVGARVLKSASGCLAQCHHKDFNDACDAENKSVILAIETGTRLELCVGGETKHVDIPRRDMLVFSGNVSHGGAAYSKENHRIFWKVVPDARKLATAKSTLGKNDYLQFNCEHNTGLQEPVGSLANSQEKNANSEPAKVTLLIEF